MADRLTDEQLEARLVDTLPCNCGENHNSPPQKNMRGFAPEHWEDCHAAFRPAVRALLIEARAELRDLRDVLLRSGLVPCDAPACNCGSWHGRHGAFERLREIGEGLGEETQGKTILGAIRSLRSRLASIAHEVGIDDCREGLSCVPGPVEKIVEEIKRMRRAASRLAEVEAERKGKEIALRNCLMLARLKLGGDDRGGWEDVLRFCENVGVAPEILRGEGGSTAAELDLVARLAELQKHSDDQHEGLRQAAQRLAESQAALRECKCRRS